MASGLRALPLVRSPPLETSRAGKSVTASHSHTLPQDGPIGDLVPAVGAVGRFGVGRQRHGAQPGAARRLRRHHLRRPARRQRRADGQPGAGVDAVRRRARRRRNRRRRHSPRGADNRPRPQRGADRSQPSRLRSARRHQGAAADGVVAEMAHFRIRRRRLDTGGDVGVCSRAVAMAPTSAGTHAVRGADAGAAGGAVRRGRAPTQATLRKDQHVVDAVRAAFCGGGGAADRRVGAARGAGGAEELAADRRRSRQPRRLRLAQQTHPQTHASPCGRRRKVVDQGRENHRRTTPHHPHCRRRKSAAATSLHRRSPTNRHLCLNNNSDGKSSGPNVWHF